MNDGPEVAFLAYALGHPDAGVRFQGGGVPVVELLMMQAERALRSLVRNRD
jgi:hypothetical protein